MLYNYTNKTSNKTNKTFEEALTSTNFKLQGKNRNTCT